MTHLYYFRDSIDSKNGDGSYSNNKLYSIEDNIVEDFDSRRELIRMDYDILSYGMPIAVTFTDDTKTSIRPMTQVELVTNGFMRLSESEVILDDKIVSIYDIPCSSTLVSRRFNYDTKQWEEGSDEDVMSIVMGELVGVQSSISINKQLLRTVSSLPEMNEEGRTKLTNELTNRINSLELELQALLLNYGKK